MSTSAWPSFQHREGVIWLDVTRQHRPMGPEDLRGFDESFIAGMTAEVWPVRFINDITDRPAGAWVEPMRTCANEVRRNGD